MSHTFNNNVQPEPTIMIGSHEVPTVPHYGESREYSCVICENNFHVLSQDPVNNHGNPVQTLFCPVCLDAIKQVRDREINQDYGW